MSVCSCAQAAEDFNYDWQFRLSLTLHSGEINLCHSDPLHAPQQQQQNAVLRCDVMPKQTAAADRRGEGRDDDDDGERKKSCGKDFPAEKIDMPLVRGKGDSNLTDKRVGKRSRAVHRFGSNDFRSGRCCHSARSGKAGWQHPPYEGIKYILQKKGKNTYTHTHTQKEGKIQTDRNQNS